MNIFFFGSDYPPTGGGISTHTREWLLALSQDPSIYGKVRIFGNKNPRVENMGNIEIQTGKSVNFLWVGMVSKWTMWKYHHYDVFHAFNLFPVGFWVVFWAKIFNKKSVLTFYGADACDKRTSKKVLWLQKWAIKNATWTITISEFAKKKVMERYGISGEGIHVIHPILPQFEPAGTENVREKLGINKDDFVVISVSRLVKRKGIEYLIDAISKIPDSSTKLIIVGGGKEKENLEKRVQNLNLSNRVFFAGKVPQLAPYYASSNVSALVSYIIEEEGDFEGLGLVLLEAQSHGLPVIGSRSGGIPEAFGENQTGLLVPERDAVAIAAAILKLKNDANLYKLMNTATREFLEKEFGRENTVGKYLRLISK